MRRHMPSVVLIVAAIVFFCLAGAQNRHLIADGRREALVIEDAPATVTFITVVLGGFRGLVADVLWLRASRLQEEGRYFELTQLADWITQLEPKAVQVWAFHAWNMAYNVSVMMVDPEDRWRWVANGIRLLRERALRMNPSAPDLYAELAWLLHHKVSTEYDPAHATYQRQFAALVASALPSGRLPPVNDEGLARVLGEKYSLRMESMRQVDAMYGPLDWRLADAHSVYWARLGVLCAAENPPARLRCERALYQAMARMFFYGTFGDPSAADEDLIRPRPDLLPRVVSCFEAALADNPDDAGILSSYITFMSSAVLFFDAQGDDARARSLYLAIVERVRRDDVEMPEFDAFVSNDGSLLAIPDYALRVVHRLRKERQ